jgi:hypothetical protein
MLQLLTRMWIPPDLFLALQFFIPKLHIYGHGEKCQYRYSFNFQKWSAHTDGEDPEWFWSHINPASLSTREMSPGTRFDALDSHAAHWNWCKIIKLGMSMLIFHEVYIKTFIFYRFIPCIMVVRCPQRTCTSLCFFS